MSPKTKKILMWVCVALLGIEFALSAVGKLTGMVAENFTRWGYSITFMYIIGVLEALGAVGLFIPSLRKWAAFGLIGIMIGAAYTHLTHDEVSMIWANVLVMAFCGAVVWLSQD